MGVSAAAPNQIIQLPKGGGALSGMGEKFSPDLQTGTGNLVLPFSLPAGRGGFEPTLQIVYSTGSGNGLFGLGWSLGIPGVTRKTSQGVPRYRDTAQELERRDTFILSGAEDLVLLDGASSPARYRPRTEGLFALIEHHTGASDHWRIAGKDGLVSSYGTPGAGASDPALVRKPQANGADPGRIFAWKLTLTQDPFGNRIEYAYEERDRATDADRKRGRDWDQHHLSCIRYGDYDADGETRFLVSVKFEYEDRPDPFSDHRAGFEVRVSKRCKAISIETHADRDRKVRRYEFEYRNGALNGVSQLVAVRVVGFDDAGQEARELPPVVFGYTEFAPQDQTRTSLRALRGKDLPAVSLADPTLELVDLFGSGLSDFLQMNGSVRYWRNLGQGRFDVPRSMKDAPAGVSLGDAGVKLTDANGDGRADLLITRPGLSGYFPLQFAARWDRRSFHRYATAPSFDLSDPEVRWIDLTGDGVSDVLRSAASLECFFCDPERGWRETRRVERRALDEFPNVSLADPRVRLADMSGDSLQDIVVVHERSVEYWPNLGYGEWGRRIRMRNAPRLPDDYDPRRLLLGDVDGDGLADIVYVDHGVVRLWLNQSGDAWSDEVTIHGTPLVSDADSLRLVDLLGTGVAGVLFTRDASSLTREQDFFLDFTGGTKPYLLDEVNNHLGAVTKIAYAPSTVFYLEDAKSARTRWKTTLPFPVQVVARVEVIDEISGGKLTTEYKYHHGHWDGLEREFRGFARVDRFDSESFELYGAEGLHGRAPFAPVERRHFSPPTCTKTWFHLGPVGDDLEEPSELDLSDEYWPGDPTLLPKILGLEASAKRLSTRRSRRDGLRALRGNILRSELYALDGSARESRPFTVTERAYGLREESPPDAAQRDRRRIFFAHALAERTTQWERGDDPMTRFTFTGEFDDVGQPRRTTLVACPRLWRRADDRPGRAYLATQSRVKYAVPLESAVYVRDRVASATTYEVRSDGSETVAELLALADGDPALTVIGQTLHFYDGDASPDGAAFVGLPYGVIGNFGALVRTDTLVLTGELLAQTYGAELAPYWVPGAVSWSAEYPAAFRAALRPLAGYAYHAGGPGSAHAQGYFASSDRRRYDFHGRAGGRGLMVARRDALENETRVGYDAYSLLPTEVVEAGILEARAEHDYRVLLPREVTEANGNRTRLDFTPSGLLRSIQVVGKTAAEGDQTVPSVEMHYDLMAFADRREPIFVRTVRRQHHDTETDVPLPERDHTIETREYSDGFARLLQTRAQAEELMFGDASFGGALLSADPSVSGPADVVGRRNPDSGAPNVIVSGWQIYDNKGRVVQKYEPFYSTGWAYAEPIVAERGQKVTSFYDARGELVRTIRPDGSETRVVHGVPIDLGDPGAVDGVTPTPWEVYTYDGNDNAGRTHPAASSDYRHHWNTPASVTVDALGRPVRAVARHRARPTTPGDPLPSLEEHVTRSSYDIRGNLTALRDSLGRLALSCSYDLEDRSLATVSSDAGLHLSVYDAAGNPIEARDAKGALSVRVYDALNRPTRLWARDTRGDSLTLREKLVYGDTPGAAAQPRDQNLRGRLYQRFDEAGVFTVASYDFKGNVCESSRQVLSDDFMLSNLRAQPGPSFELVAPRVDWEAPAPDVLDAAVHTTRARFDALNRVKLQEYPACANGERYRLRPSYNRAGALESVEMEGPLAADGQGPRTPYVTHLGYDALGRRTLVVYGNQVMTRYLYDPRSARLSRMRTERVYAAAADLYRATGSPLADLVYTYDLAGNVLAIQDRTPGCGVVGNPAGLTATEPALGALLSAGDALVREFSYDPLYRLVSATGRECAGIARPRGAGDDPRCGYDSGNHGTPDQDNAPYLAALYREAYEYDAGSNLLSLRHQELVAQGGTARWDTTWSRNFGMGGRSADDWAAEASIHLSGDWANPPGNQLTHLQSRTSGIAAPVMLSATHAYDPSGNLVRENTERHFEWDHADRMKVFRNQTGTAQPTTYALYAYDSTGQRVKKVVWDPSGYRTTTYLGAGFELHRRLKPGELRENNELYVMDGERRIAALRVGGAFPDDGAGAHPVRYQLGDHLQSITLVVSGDGTWINREEYFPFGETSFGSFGRKRYRFTGRERDQESGLTYHGDRYYAPALVRWTAADREMGPDGPNLYVYARDNPLKFVDPEGRQAIVAEPDGPEGRAYQTTNIVLDRASFERLEMLLDERGTGNLRYSPQEVVEIVEVDARGKAKGYRLTGYGILEINTNNVKPGNSDFWKQLNDIAGSRQPLLILNTLDEVAGVNRPDAGYVESTDRTALGKALDFAMATSAHSGLTLPSRTLDKSGGPTSPFLGFSIIYLGIAQDSKTLGHELFLHFYNLVQGKPWKHPDVDPNIGDFEKNLPPDVANIIDRLGAEQHIKPSPHKEVYKRWDAKKKPAKSKPVPVAPLR